jgi:hypothetical protein
MRRGRRKEREWEGNGMGGKTVTAGRGDDRESGDGGDAGGRQRGGGCLAAKPRRWHSRGGAQRDCGGSLAVARQRRQRHGGSLGERGGSGSAVAALSATAADAWPRQLGGGAAAAAACWRIFTLNMTKKSQWICPRWLGSGWLGSGCWLGMFVYCG